MQLYKLTKVCDNPIYEGFGFARTIRDEDYPGFRPADREPEGRTLRIRRLSASWIPQEVVGRVRQFNDYPCVSLTIPAFSRRAVDALRDFLEPNGELLPLVSGVGEYYAYNITTVADVLDSKKSQIRWLDDGMEHVPANVYEIERYECRTEKMLGLSIFRMVEIPWSVYVTGLFVDRATEHGLKGMHLTKLWPLPEGESWRTASRAQWRSEQEIERDGHRISIKANTVALIFRLVNGEEGERQKRRLSEIMDEIDKMLYDPLDGVDSPYFGNLEEQEFDDDDCQVLLSCPDADALVEKMRPWLRQLSWDVPITVMKRYGRYTDPDCREESVTI